MRRGAQTAELERRAHQNLERAGAGSAKVSGQRSRHADGTCREATAHHEQSPAVSLEGLRAQTHAVVARRCALGGSRAA